MNREDSYRIQVLPQAHRNAYITRRPLPSFHNVRHGERTRLTRHCPREYRWRRVAHECCQECDCSPFQVLIPVRVVVRVWTRFRHSAVCHSSFRSPYECYICLACGFRSLYVVQDGSCGGERGEKCRLAREEVEEQDLANFRDWTSLRI